MSSPLSSPAPVPPLPGSRLPLYLPAPPPAPTYPFQHPHSYSLPFASTSYDPYPASGPTKPATLPDGPPWFFRPLAAGGGGDVRGYLGRPTPIGLPESPTKAEVKKGEVKATDGAGEAEKMRKAWEEYYRSGGPQQQRVGQIIAPAPAPAAPKGEKVGGGSEAGLMPRIGYYVPPGTVEGALVATWPKGVKEPSRTLM